MLGESLSEAATVPVIVGLAEIDPDTEDDKETLGVIEGVSVAD